MSIKEIFNSILIHLGLREEKQEDTSVKPEDIVYNENIQGEFFGVPFGATKEDVIEAFAKQNLFPTEDSTNTLFVFRGPLRKDRISYLKFSFGEFEWNEVRVWFSNKNFYYIRFVAIHNDKEIALHNCYAVSMKLDTKYKMYNEREEDPRIIMKRIGFGKNERRVWSQCNYGLTPAENVEANVFLDYADFSFMKENNEL